MAAENIREEKGELPLQEEQTDESAEGDQPRGEPLPEEQRSSLSSPPPGRSIVLVGVGNSAEGT